MAALAPLLKFREFDSNGDPLVGGKLHSYLAGTTTPVATYIDQSGGTPNTNPVILDADGRANVWLNTSTNYKFVLKDANDVDIYTVDNVSASSGGGGGGSSATVTHNVTDGQAATNLTGETVDFALYTTAVYDVEIIRGTTVISNGTLAVQNLNGTGRVIIGPDLNLEDHGVTFSVSQASLVVQLRAALSTGPGNGTIKLSRRLISV